LIGNAAKILDQLNARLKTWKPWQSARLSINA